MQPGLPRVLKKFGPWLAVLVLGLSLAVLPDGAWAAKTRSKSKEAVRPPASKVQTKARAKESLADVARRCAVDVAALAGWNQIARKRWSTRLKPGATLALWVPRERSGEFAAAAAPPLAKPTKPTLAPKAGEGAKRRT